MTLAQPNPAQLIDQLLRLPDLAAQQQHLASRRDLWQDPAFAADLAEGLKRQADHFLRVEISRSEALAALILHLAHLTNNPLFEALSRRAEGNIRGIGAGNFQAAIDCYDAAAAIYRAEGQPLDEAKTQVGKIGCLSHLSRYQEALQTGEWASRVLREHAAWPLLTGLLSNLGIIYYRLGQGHQAVALLEEARDICRQTGVDQELAGVEVNYAFVLRSVGQLEASIAADQRAYDLFSARGHAIEAARVQASMATTYLFYGRFNQALALFEQVLAVYLADQRHYDAILVQLYVTDCLLQLGRFADVLAGCDRIRPLFDQIGANLDIARTLLNEAIAYAGLRQYDQALASLAEARAQFEAEGNVVGIVVSDLERASLDYRQAAYQASYETALACRAVFQANQLRIQAAQATLVAARSGLALNRETEVRELLAAVQTMTEREDIPWLHSQLYHLLGQLAQRQHHYNEATAAYEQAIHHLERLRGQVMIEFRADFLADKQRVYEDMVGLLLDLGQPEPALQYVERAKSRALVDMLAFQLDLRLQPRSAEDRPLVEELAALRARRNQLVRGWTATMDNDKPSQEEMQETLLALEQQITDRWHTLLIHNADYARDAALAGVRAEPIQPYLDAETLLIEYFIVDQELVVFLVSATEIRVQRLPGHLAQLAAPSRLLNLSFKAVPHSSPDQLARLTLNSQTQLGQLHRWLIAPLAETLADYQKLIIVPHGPLLHYLPFHALHDGETYLIERYEVSYLPSASLLHYAAGHQPAIAAALNVAAFGYSANGQLPYTPREATAIADLLGGQAFVEAAATLPELQAAGANTRVLHLATHGDFNPDNPLFSGLTLADGQLSTLDIFNLRLPASLVTLSACQTGRSVVKGGDELLGLMRAFLYAGAASLILSHWRVADQATVGLMYLFYQNLAQGYPKGEALRLAQQTFIRHPDPLMAHPYSWASFFLVGDSGRL